MPLTHLSDDELLASLTNICFQTRKLLARLLLHLIEVEERRLDLRLACSSLYDFCRRKLGMSESEAVRRIEAARLVKRFPSLVEEGNVNLTTLLLLRPHLTDDNVSTLVVGAKGKTKLEVQELIAAGAPKPDVMTTLTPLPALEAAPSPAKEDRPRVEPLSPKRYRLDMTVSDAVRAKLERARDLLGYRIASGDLEGVLDRALDALLAKLEKERPDKTPHGGASRGLRARWVHLHEQDSQALSCDAPSRDRSRRSPCTRRKQAPCAARVRRAQRGSREARLSAARGRAGGRSCARRWPPVHEALRAALVLLAPPCNVAQVGMRAL